MLSTAPNENIPSDSLLDSFIGNFSALLAPLLVTLLDVVVVINLALVLLLLDKYYFF